MITACVITLSDKGSRGQRRDESGPAVAEALAGIGASVEHTVIIPDEKALIKESLLAYCGRVDLILTTGGTGLSPRDVTPEATLEVVEREVPGMAEAMRAASLKSTNRAVLSRAVAGVRGETLIINLPGSPRAAVENLAVLLGVIPHAIEKIKGSEEDCAR